MIELFWAFGLVLLFYFFLMVMIRNRVLAWGWNFAIVAIILYASLFKMTGNPRDIWLFSSIENVHGEVEIVYSQVIPHKYIYLLIREVSGAVPYYVRIPWRASTEKDLQTQKMKADQQETALMANVDKLSEWNDKITDESETGSVVGAGNKKGDTQLQSAPGDHPKDGGDQMFYLKPVQPDPLKTHQQTIELPAPPEPVPPS